MSVIALALTSLGLIIAWRMDSTQGFHAIMNLVLLPIWLLSGALFPVADAPIPLRWLMLSNPMTYGLSALRSCLYLKDGAATGAIAPLTSALAITLVFCLISFAAAVATAQRSQS
jgi:ABC-2 type transport system permease protein